VEVTDRGLVLRELREDLTIEDVQKLTEPKLIVEGEIRRM
jgi:acyl CoA:acetate/3-ketoacid CoA transferase beta subunit